MFHLTTHAQGAFLGAGAASTVSRHPREGGLIRDALTGWMPDRHAGAVGRAAARVDGILHLTEHPPEARTT
jgi:hypothetical protein